MKIQAAHIQKLEGDSLSIPLGAMVLVEFDGLRQRFRTEFVGMERGKYLQLRLPRSINLRSMLHKDRPLTIRYLGGGGRISGFKTLVLAQSPQPFPLLFLEYPRTVEVLNQRESERVNCFLPATLVRDDIELPCVISDISVTGCRALLDLDPDAPALSVEPDAPLVFRFKMFPDQDDLEIAGHIKSVKATERRMSIGAAFDVHSRAIHESIETYVDMVRAYLTERQPSI